MEVEGRKEAKMKRSQEEEDEIRKRKTQNIFVMAGVVSNVTDIRTDNQQMHQRSCQSSLFKQTESGVVHVLPGENVEGVERDTEFLPTELKQPQHFQNSENLFLDGTKILEDNGISDTSTVGQGSS